MTFAKIQSLARIFWFGPKQNEALQFGNEFQDKSAQTDCSKETWIPILKGLKHLNTVIFYRNGEFFSSSDFVTQYFVGIFSEPLKI